MKRIVLYLVSSSALVFGDSFGMEINPLRLILISNGIDTFSGGFNYFNDENRYEISFPLTYNKISYQNKYNRYKDYPDTSLTFDVHYRKFLFSNRANGFYIGALGRYTYIEGKVKNDFKIATAHRFGMGGEIGIRLRDRGNKTYWGVSFAYGQHFDNYGGQFKHDNFITLMDGKKNFWDIEFFKFGYEF